MCACVCVCACSHLIYFTMSLQYYTGLLYSSRPLRQRRIQELISQDAPHSYRPLRPFIGSDLVLGCDGNLIGGDTSVVKGSLEVGQCRGPDPEPTSAASARLPRCAASGRKPKIPPVWEKKKTSAMSATIITHD